jgi:tetratricopeptide (TPR) repeat protein
MPPSVCAGDDPRPLLSATLIVRNEEAFLAGCLASLQGLADEIVVVDTGSVDATRAIARAYDARLYEFPWRDDFAAARNFALDQASGDWILYIDADERVRPFDRATLADEFVAPGLCAATLRFHPQTGFTAYRELRLFQRRADIRFEGEIHETVVPSLDRLVGGQGAVIGHSRLMIDHLGYDGGTVRKHERDLPLLQRSVKIDPDRAYLWWHLGAIHREAGRPGEAEHAWLSGIEAARRAPRRLAEQSLCFVELAKHRLIEGRNCEALEVVGEVRARQGNNFLLDCLEARALAALQRCDEALAIFERLAGVDADALVDDFAYDRNIFGAGALAEAGLALFRLGRYSESATWYGRAQALSPGSLEISAKQQLALARLLKSSSPRNINPF